MANVNISLQEATKNKLQKLKKIEFEPYNAVICRLIDFYEEKHDIY